MKIAMTDLRNEMCDHWIDLTAHCNTCTGLYRLHRKRQDDTATIAQLSMLIAATAWTVYQIALAIGV